MGNDTTSQIEYFARAMKAPRIGEAAARLADQARDAGWSHEEYLAAVLSREVSAREASGAELRIRAAGFPGRKSLEEFTFDHQPGLKRDTIAHLGTGVFLTEAKNVVLLGPPGTGKTHLAIGLGIKAAHTGCSSRPPPSGLPASRPRTGPTGSRPSWSGCGVTV
jgi:DNA replication protein DnaC